MDAKFAPEFEALFSLHRQVMRAIGEAAQPVLFGGMAVFAVCRPEHFRPLATTFSSDLDYLVAPADRAVWEHCFDCRFVQIESSYMQGWKTSFHLGEAHIDLLSEATFWFPVHDQALGFDFDKAGLPPVVRRFAGIDTLIANPAAMLAFKLLLGRGAEKGKHDLEDASALIVDTEVTPRQVFDAIFRQNPPAPAYRQLLAQRLQRCVELSEASAVESFASQFRAAFGADLII